MSDDEPKSGCPGTKRRAITKGSEFICYPTLIETSQLKQPESHHDRVRREGCQGLERG